MFSFHGCFGVDPTRTHSIALVTSSAVTAQKIGQGRHSPARKGEPSLGLALHRMQIAFSYPPTHTRGVYTHSTALCCIGNVPRIFEQPSGKKVRARAALQVESSLALHCSLFPSVLLG